MSQSTRFSSEPESSSSASQAKGSLTREQSSSIEAELQRLREVCESLRSENDALKLKSPSHVSNLIAKNASLFSQNESLKAQIVLLSHENSRLSAQSGERLREIEFLKNMCSTLERSLHNANLAPTGSIEPRPSINHLAEENGRLKEILREKTTKIDQSLLEKDKEIETLNIKLKQFEEWQTNHFTVWTSFNHPSNTLSRSGSKILRSSASSPKKGKEDNIETFIHNDRPAGNEKPRLKLEETPNPDEDNGKSPIILQKCDSVIQEAPLDNEMSMSRGSGNFQMSQREKEVAKANENHEQLDDPQPDGGESNQLNSLFFSTSLK